VRVEQNQDKVEFFDDKNQEVYEIVIAAREDAKDLYL